MNAVDFLNLPKLIISSPVPNISHLPELDVDFHMPTDNNLNYHSSHEFHSNKNIIECLSNLKAFSALHCNIRSLSANYVCFLQMLLESPSQFPLIGLSETKFTRDKNILQNVNITGYDFISGPRLSSAGRVAFYIKSNFRYMVRSIKSPTDYLKSPLTSSFYFSSYY